jgi:hypothetical protein
MARDGDDGRGRRDRPPPEVLLDRVTRLRKLMSQMAVLAIELEDLIRGIEHGEPADGPRG